MDVEDPVVSPVDRSPATLAAGLSSVLEHRAGRLWLWDRMAKCGVFGTTFHRDPYIAAFNEGRRSVGLEILRDISVNFPEKYMLMINEARLADAALGSGGPRGARSESEGASS